MVDPVRSVSVRYYPATFPLRDARVAALALGQTPSAPPPAAETAISPYTLALFQYAANALRADPAFLGADRAQLPLWLLAQANFAPALAVRASDLSQAPMSDQTRALFQRAIQFYDLEQRISRDKLMAFFAAFDANGQGLTYDALRALNLATMNREQAEVAKALMRDKGLFLTLASLDGDRGALSLQDIWIASADQDVIVLNADVISQLRSATQIPASMPDSTRDFREVAGALMRLTGPAGHGISQEGLQRLNLNAVTTLSAHEKAWVEQLRQPQTLATLAPLNIARDELSLAAMRAYWAFYHLPGARSAESGAAALILPPANLRLGPVASVGGQSAMAGDLSQPHPGAAPDRAALPMGIEDLTALMAFLRSHGSLSYRQLLETAGETPEQTHALALLRDPARFREMAALDGHAASLSIGDVETRVRQRVSAALTPSGEAPNP
ncbi:MAG: hypothetical protein IPK79_05250 [Vampirovibrionales bacterium]|nr:hypothetical protein [Vampirovibrionales bacterium]